eukprot:3432610-Rhodomonas_salina.1
MTGSETANFGHLSPTLTPHVLVAHELEVLLAEAERKRKERGAASSSVQSSPAEEPSLKELDTRPTENDCSHTVPNSLQRPSDGGRQVNLNEAVQGPGTTGTPGTAK